MGMSFLLSVVLVSAASAQVDGARSSPATVRTNPAAAPGYGGYGGYGYGGYNPYGTTSGFYNPGYAGITYPTFGAPQSIGGSFYSIPSGRAMLPMWHAPSGYYYPWAPRPAGFSYAYPLPILSVQNSAPTPALPPLSTVYTDMSKFLEKAKEDKKINDSDYMRMSRRIKDLQSKTRHLRISGDGHLDPTDEEQLRRDIEQVGDELSWRVNR